LQGRGRCPPGRFTGGCSRNVTAASCDPTSAGPTTPPTRRTRRSSSNSSRSQPPTNGTIGGRPSQPRRTSRSASSSWTTSSSSPFLQAGAVSATGQQEISNSHVEICRLRRLAVEERSHNELSPAHCARIQPWRDAMKYLCLIYDDESKWGTMPKDQSDA